MVRSQVFLGAPSLEELRQHPTAEGYRWHVISPAPPAPDLSIMPVFPTATLEAAIRRVSVMYQNVIFDKTEEIEEPHGSNEHSVEESQYRENQTTTFTWPPTVPTTNVTSSRLFTTGISDVHPSILRLQSYRTQETQETASYDYTDASSIARFPAYHFSLHNLTSLSAIAAKPQMFPRARTLNFLLVVLECEGPESITIKQGSDAGKSVAILKMILGDDEGEVCKLTAWREVAEAWGGAGDTPGVKRGDIVYIENATSVHTPGTTPMLTASPRSKSTLAVCYRTMPYTHEDGRLRPDLRLGASDATVRRVSEVVMWFERMAGLS